MSDGYVRVTRRDPEDAVARAAAETGEKILNAPSMLESMKQTFDQYIYWANAKRMFNVPSYLFGAESFSPCVEVQFDPSLTFAWDELELAKDPGPDDLKKLDRVDHDVKIGRPLSSLTIKYTHELWKPNAQARGELAALMAMWKERGWTEEVEDVMDSIDFDEDVGHHEKVTRVLFVPLSDVRFFRRERRAARVGASLIYLDDVPAAPVVRPGWWDRAVGFDVAEGGMRMLGDGSGRLGTPIQETHCVKAEETILTMNRGRVPASDLRNTDVVVELPHGYTIVDKENNIAVRDNLLQAQLGRCPGCGCTQGCVHYPGCPEGEKAFSELSTKEQITEVLGWECPTGHPDDIFSGKPFRNPADAETCGACGCPKPKEQ